MLRSDGLHPVTLVIQVSKELGLLSMIPELMKNIEFIGLDIQVRDLFEGDDVFGAYWQRSVPERSTLIHHVNSSPVLDLKILRTLYSLFLTFNPWR